MEDVYGKPGHLFRRMQQIAVAIFMEECAEFELTPVQYAALVAIREHPGIDATRLAAVIAFDRSTIGDVLERLEAKELIVRRATPHDKRLKLLRVTPRGRKLLADILPAVDRAQERMLAPLGQADRRKLIALASQLVDLNNARSRAPHRPLENVGAQSAGRSRS
jgi:DNA-binding MarR family transcriptional regulator